MRFEEIDQDLETQFGKETSQTIADANIEYCIEILNNRVINENLMQMLSNQALMQQLLCCLH